MIGHEGKTNSQQCDGREIKINEKYPGATRNRLPRK
jgi:hypothetical protein